MPRRKRSPQLMASEPEHSAQLLGVKPITGGIYSAESVPEEPADELVDIKTRAPNMPVLDAEVAVPVPVLVRQSPEDPSPPVQNLAPPATAAAKEIITKTPDDPAQRLSARSSPLIINKTAVPLKPPSAQERVAAAKIKPRPIARVPAAKVRRSQNLRKRAASKKKVTWAKKQARKRAIKRIASIRHATTRKENQRRIIRQKKFAKRKKLAKRKKAAQRAKTTKRNRAAQRRANRRFIRKQRYRRARRHHLTYREYQMLA